jgi:nitronate monooxygenase
VSVSKSVPLFGTELPIIQAPMAGVQGSVLAIAVSNAGGLGSVPAAMLTPDRLRDELAATTSRTSRPYNVNFFCHSAPAPDNERDTQWRGMLAPYYREFGIDARDIPPGPARAPFNHDAADVLAQFQPLVVSFHFGLPSRELLDRVRQWKATILSSATTIEEARWLEAQGVDAIIAQGLEAGGHRGMFLTDDLTTQLGTLALVRQIVRVVKVPVIAAGGIADADGVVAALALGAAAVQIGTAYLLCPEATTTPVHREALSSSRATHTAVTNVFTGRPARSIVNRLVAEIGPLNAAAPQFPLAAAAVMPLRSKAESRGSGDFSPLWSGQNASGCKNIPAAALTRELAGRI